MLLELGQKETNRKIGLLNTNRCFGIGWRMANVITTDTFKLQTKKETDIITSHIALFNRLSIERYAVCGIAVQRTGLIEVCIDLQCAGIRSMAKIL